MLGHKILHRILVEELLELPVELPGQGLIVRYDQSGLEFAVEFECFLFDERFLFILHEKPPP